MGYMKDSDGERLDSFPVKAPLQGVNRTIITRGGAVALGDSITAWGSANFDQHGHVYWNLLGVMTNQRIRTEGFYATAGYTMEQIESVHLPQVLALDPAPGASFLAMGTNNTGATFSITTMAATLKRFTDALTAKNIVPVLCTIPPRTGSTTGNNQVTQWNAYVRSYAAEQGFPLMDNHAALVEATTGEFASGLLSTADGTGVHPSEAGHTSMATLAANDTALVNRFPAGQPYMARGINDAANLLGNSSLFIVDTNADGIADGWTSALGAAATASVVTDGSVKGKWQRLSKASAQAGTGYVFRDVTLLSSTITGITATAATDTLSKTAHGFTEGERVQFTTAPEGLATGVDYYIRDAAADTFKVAATRGGAALNITADSTLRIMVRSQVQPGDRFTLACRIRAASDNTTFSILQARCIGPEKFFDSRLQTSVDGTYFVTGVVPSGTTSIRIQLMVTGTASAANTTDFGQVTFVNLTALGL